MYWFQRQLENDHDTAISQLELSVQWGSGPYIKGGYGFNPPPEMLEKFFSHCEKNMQQCDMYCIYKLVYKQGYVNIVFSILIAVALIVYGDFLLVFSSDFFNALHGMQTRSCDENSVCLSVCSSVTRVYCDKTVQRSVQIYIPYERTFSLVSWEEEWLVGSARWLQASMPIKHGGLGIRRVTSLAASAFLASAASTLVLQEQILAQFSCPTDSFLDSYLSCWSTSAGPPPDPLPGKQSFWDNLGLQADRAFIENSFVEPSLSVFSTT